MHTYTVTLHFTDLDGNNQVDEYTTQANCACHAAEIAHDNINPDAAMCYAEVLTPSASTITINIY